MKQNRESDISFFQRYLTVWVFLCMVAGVPLGVSNVSVPFDTLILSVVLFMVFPLAGGFLTRMFVTRSRGADYFENVFIQKCGSASTEGQLLALVLILMGQSKSHSGKPAAHRTDRSAVHHQPGVRGILYLMLRIRPVQSERRYSRV